MRSVIDRSCGTHRRRGPIRRGNPTRAGRPGSQRHPGLQEKPRAGASAARNAAFRSRTVWKRAAGSKAQARWSTGAARKALPAPRIPPQPPTATDRARQQVVERIPSAYTSLRLVGLPVAELLGRRVAARAEMSRVPRSPLAKSPGNAEVDDRETRIAHHDVRWLQIAMDQRRRELLVQLITPSHRTGNHCAARASDPSRSYTSSRSVRPWMYSMTTTSSSPVVWTS